MVAEETETTATRTINGVEGMSIEITGTETTTGRLGETNISLMHTATDQGLSHLGLMSRMTSRDIGARDRSRGRGTEMAEIETGIDIETESMT